MRKRYSSPMKFAMLSVVMLSITCVLFLDGVMADQNQVRQEMADDENIIPLPQTTVSIEKKMIEAVVTKTGDRFKLSDETIIIGLDGQQVSIRKMLVPCDAQITYETKRGRRIAQRIKMLSVSGDGSWRWHSDKPE